MTEPDEPSRLFEDPSTPEGLKQVLRSAERDVGSDAEVARLAERLGPLLGAGAAVGTGVSAGTGATALSGTAKLGLAALAAAALGGGVWWLTSTNAPAVDEPAPVASVASVVAPPSELAVPSPPPSPSVAAPPEPAVSVAPAREKPPASAQLSEAELLEQARLALKSDPSRALSRVSEHERRFPRGVLVQEREVLAIQALRRLGRDAEAERRAEAFAKAFPGSAFQRKLKTSP